MAVTTTTRLAGTSTFIVDVTATADADTTTGNVAHGLGAIPLDYSTAMLLALAATAQPGWALTTVDATNIVATKNTAVGSGQATPQVRIKVSLPHSIVR